MTEEILRHSICEPHEPTRMMTNEEEMILRGDKIIALLDSIDSRLICLEEEIKALPHREY